MNSARLSCEFCEFVTFSNTSNKKRHFMRNHNFAYHKAKTCIREAKTTPIYVYDDFFLAALIPEVVLEVEEEKQSHVDELKKQFMEEDDDIFMELKVLEVEGEKQSHVDELKKQFMEDEEDDNIFKKLKY